MKRQARTEVAVTAKRIGSEEWTTAYATGADFCRIFKEDMKNLYLLSLLLTADPAKAEQCFVAGLDDCAGSNQVFKEWTRSWARRAIVKNAVRVIAPEPVYVNAASNVAVSRNATDRTRPEVQAEFSALLGLTAFERFAFVMSVLEGYSDQECALLLGCTRHALIAARVRAAQEIARSTEIQHSSQAEAAFKNDGSGIGLTRSLPLATLA
jgi:hypothetical protein